MTLQAPTIPSQTTLPSPPTPPAASTAVDPRRRQAILGALIALATVAVAFAHRDTLGSALERLATANAGWLSIAVLAVVGYWLAGTACQIGSLPATPPIGPLFLVQIAGTFANQVLPGGIGGALVNLRFLVRHGIPIPIGVASFALNSAAGGIAHVLLLITAGLLFPEYLTAVLTSVPIAGTGLIATGVVAALVAVIVVVWRKGGGRLRLPASIDGLPGRQSTGMRAVALDPGRAAALWGGSLANPLLHALALYAVGRSLGMTLSLAAVVVISLTVSALVGLLPAPGGLGAFDVLLPLALVGAGVDLETAVAVTMAYRLITVWLLLIPSGALLAGLVRRQVL